MIMNSRRLIETDGFAFEFLSQLGERESWRKELHRPIYHIHKWWAKRLGTVFRGILLGCVLDEGADLQSCFYQPHSFSGLTVLDPFMGSGTSIGEAHKLGLSALGRDINPVAVDAVRVALGPLQRRNIKEAFEYLSEGVGKTIRALYQAYDSRNHLCDVLYYFWVMQAPCPRCRRDTDLFSSYIIAKNARPSKKTIVHIVCPSCGRVFAGTWRETDAVCPACGLSFAPQSGPVAGRKAVCALCREEFTILDALGGNRPRFRLYGKLVLRKDGEKEYLAASQRDLDAYSECSKTLQEEIRRGSLEIPTLRLQNGYNTKQAMNYGFLAWSDFFNDRQLLALSMLRRSIAGVSDSPARNALLTLFSGILEFNNMFASYKGEGTGAVRHMFSHHILKPERMPIEANVWGTPKSSGSFSSLFRSRLLRAIEYRDAPTEVNGLGTAVGRVCSAPFTGNLSQWGDPMPPHGIALSCGDSSHTGLPDSSVDLVVTDPPFFDNVHYSELADFFYAWHKSPNGPQTQTTRNAREVQDADASEFARKLQAVFCECRRVLKNNGLLVFTYHHSRGEGWKAVAEATFDAGFTVVNSHPVKAEMSVATPKSQAKEPIQLDIIIVCRKSDATSARASIPDALAAARMKLMRLRKAGFHLSLNDRRVVFFGQLLTTLRSASDADAFEGLVQPELEDTRASITAAPRELLLFPDD
jgi:putative DNA methylase